MRERTKEGVSYKRMQTFVQEEKKRGKKYSPNGAHLTWTCLIKKLLTLLFPEG